VAFGEQAVGDSGRFRFRNLPAGEYRVGVTGPSEDYIPQSCTLRIDTGRPTERDFFLVKQKMTIVLEGVNFETGRADILPQFVAVLDRAGEILKQTPDIRVELAGHTDPREINTREFPSNWELSKARAEAVRQHLMDKFGIAPGRLTANGYADTQPIAPNDSPEGMARNRRTEFRILEQ
jgi:outer membrane protein OmpA-like peptidoglycan-associated protein